MAEEYKIESWNLTILIISPDHFWDTQSNNQTYVQSIWSVCFQWECIKKQGIFSVNSNKKIPDILITKEHWRWSHFHFINRYFPNAEVILLKTVPRDLNQIDSLLKKIQNIPIKNKLLVISSVDFSHYTSESFAKLHDKTSIYTLGSENTKKSDFKKLEVDCPSCLYLTNTRAKTLWYEPQLMMRDSSSIIVWRDLWTGNTSRQIIFYKTGIKRTKWITIGLAGDLIFDRNVSSKLSTDTKINQHFKDRFQDSNLNLNPKTNIHRKGFWIDILWFNLETPLVRPWTSCEFSKNKTVTFCSNEKIITILSELGRNIANMANNHSLDNWKKWELETKSILSNNNISYFGNDKIEYLDIRWISIALHWYNLLDTKSWNIVQICNSIKTDKIKNNKIILSLHRGKEFANKHSYSQEWLAKYFIDCWADAIIWHHPHVVQDIQRYKNKPIIYSLGNFLFDQYTSQSQTGIIVLLDIPLSGQIQLRTENINSTP